jgi:hypothetical protein
MKTQRRWVEEQLRLHGEITRNQCLTNYISRLGAIVCDLKASGWELEASRREGDYVYKLVDAPKKPVMYVRHPLTGERITTEQLASI